MILFESKSEKQTWSSLHQNVVENEWSGYLHWRKVLFRTDFLLLWAHVFVNGRSGYRESKRMNKPCDRVRQEERGSNSIYRELHDLKRIRKIWKFIASADKCIWKRDRDREREKDTCVSYVIRWQFPTRQTMHMQIIELQYNRIPPVNEREEKIRIGLVTNERDQPCESEIVAKLFSTYYYTAVELNISRLVEERRKFLVNNLIRCNFTLISDVFDDWID